MLLIGGQLPAAFRDYIVDGTIGSTIFRKQRRLFYRRPALRLAWWQRPAALGAELPQTKIDDTPDQNAINGNLFGLSAADNTRHR
jgi:hypothetical protein